MLRRMGILLVSDFYQKSIQLKYDIRKSDINNGVPFRFLIFHFDNNGMQMHRHIIRTWPRYIAKGLFFAIKYKLLFNYLGQYCTQIAIINQPFNSCMGLNLFEFITSLQFFRPFRFYHRCATIITKCYL